MMLELWLKYADGREYTEYHRANDTVPESVSLSALRESAQQAGNRVVASAWRLVEVAE